jgi:hypothetical protein
MFIVQFNYMRTNSDGYGIYQTIRPDNHQVFYLQFYDEGFFFNGFWVSILKPFCLCKVQSVLRVSRIP